MNVKGSYSFLVKGNNDTKSIRVEVTNPDVASVQLENPSDPRGAKYRITGKQEGTTYIIYEISDTQASVKIDVQKGVQPHGTSVRKTISFVS